MKIKMSELIFHVAEATADMAKKAGGEVSLSSLYSKEPTAMAMAARFMVSHIELVSGQKVELINDICTKP
jgi:hypothetical protein